MRQGQSIKPFKIKSTSLISRITFKTVTSYDFFLSCQPSWKGTVLFKLRDGVANGNHNLHLNICARHRHLPATPPAGRRAGCHTAKHPALATATIDFHRLHSFLSCHLHYALCTRKRLQSFRVLCSVSQPGSIGAALPVRVLAVNLHAKCHRRSGNDVATFGGVETDGGEGVIKQRANLTMAVKKMPPTGPAAFVAVARSKDSRLLEAFNAARRRSSELGEWRLQSGDVERGERKSYTFTRTKN